MFNYTLPKHQVHMKNDGNHKLKTMKDKSHFFNLEGYWVASNSTYQLQ